MKTAMWAVFLFILGIIGIVLINIFGNITTTNQQDYTLIKNTTEAAMLDALDIASYRGGFYICFSPSKIHDGNTQSENGKQTIQFDNKSEYTIRLRRPGVEANSNEICNLLVNEYKINQDVFIESFLRRLSNNINNNKSYRVTVQEVIEYPPKVSIRIDTYNTYNSTESTTLEFSEGDFNIRNQIDAILEEKY